MLIRGRGPFTQHWYSLCSRHREYSKDCLICQHGQWVYVVVNKIDSFVHLVAYPLWFWWHNRPGSRSRRFLEANFPKLH